MNEHKRNVPQTFHRQFWMKIAGNFCLNQHVIYKEAHINNFYQFIAEKVARKIFNTSIS